MPLRRCEALASHVRFGSLADIPQRGRIGPKPPLANYVRDFEGMAQTLRTVKLPPSARAQLVSATVLISEFSDRYLWY
jgi:hypothetical protein